MLWPDEGVANLDARLSVAASLLRKALGKAGGSQVIAGDRERLWLDRAAVTIDVEDFLDEAARGLEAGMSPEADLHLGAAQAAYAGEFLDEDAYADWAVALREEARAAYVAVARRLAERAAARGDHETAVRQLLRVLERDAFDEPAHLALVGELAAGRHHGEARRMYRGYVARMAEIGVEPAAYPASAAERELKAPG
jgi:DNA-binding SARP family transcriptional activator